MLLCTTNKKPGWHGHQGLRGAGPEQRLKTASDLKRPAQPIVALRRDSHRGSAPELPSWLCAAGVTVHAIRGRTQRSPTPPSLEGSGRSPATSHGVVAWRGAREESHGAASNSRIEAHPPRQGCTCCAAEHGTSSSAPIQGFPSPARRRRRGCGRPRSQRSWIRVGAVRQRGCGEAGGGCGGAGGDSVLNKKPESQTDALSDASRPQTPPSE